MKKEKTQYTQKKTHRKNLRKQIFPKVVIVKKNLRTLVGKTDEKLLKWSLIAKINKKITVNEINKIKENLINLNGLIKNKGKIKVFVLIFPTKTFTKKGLLVRMGGGKGKIIGKGLFLRKNQLCFELLGLISPTYTSSSIFHSFLNKYKFFKLKSN